MPTVTNPVVGHALKVYQSVTSPREGMRLALEALLEEVNKGRSYHRPVCASCQVEMRPETNGVGVLDMAEFGPVSLWDADLWKCPSCGHQIVAGFGDSPISRHGEGKSFEDHIEHYRRHSIVVESR